MNIAAPVLDINIGVAILIQDLCTLVLVQK